MKKAGQIIKFIDKHHSVRMYNLLNKAGKNNEASGKVDIEYGTAFYLLSSIEDIYRKALPFIGDGIQFKNMLAKQDFSSGEKVIVKLAANLFNGSYKNITPLDIIGYLDNELFETAMCAMSMRYYQGLYLEDLLDNENGPALEEQ